MEIVRMGNSPARTHAAGGRPDRASLQWMKTVDESVNPKLKESFVLSGKVSVNLRKEKK
jgi:hypothetical protein